MKRPVEQSDACAHDCGHHAAGHDCSHEHDEPQNVDSPQSVHAPEGALSRIVGLMDIAGVFASAVCTVHCLLVPLIVALLPVLARPIMEHDIVHVGLAGFVLVFCLVAYIPGYLNHRDSRLIWLAGTGLTLVFFATFVARQWGELVEASVISAGNAIIIFGHLLNRKLLAHLRCKHQ